MVTGLLTVIEADSVEVRSAVAVCVKLASEVVTERESDDDEEAELKSEAETLIDADDDEVGDDVTSVLRVDEFEYGSRSEFVLVRDFMREAVFLGVSDAVSSSVPLPTRDFVGDKRRVAVSDCV